MAKLVRQDFYYLVKIVVIFATYFVTARFGLTFDAVSGFATLIWLPSGISLASLLIFGNSIWPAIFLGAFLANFLNSAPPLVALGIGVGNTLEAVLATYILKRIGFDNSLERLTDVIKLLIVAALFSTAVSATIGVTSLLLGGIVSTKTYTSTWIAWWIGDMISDLVVAPFLLILRKLPQFKLNINHIAEALTLGLLLLIVGLSILQILPIPFVAYLIFPVLIWASLRFKQRGAVTANFALSATIVLRNIFYPDPSGGNLQERLLAGQLFMVTTSVVTLILATIASEREKLEARKDEFISVASHELKTPIAAIKGYGEILTKLLQNTEDKRILDYLSRMDQQINRLTKLIMDLLDVSRIQTNKLDLEREQVKIDELTKEIIADMKLTTKHKIIFEGGSKNFIMADKYRISEVLTNILSNAIKYSPKADKVFVKVSDNSDGVIVSVQDFGIGISAKHLNQIFERFFQVENRIRQSFAGLGLGLYISSQIIKSHGGKIWAESVKGKGSTISFELPA